MPAIKLPNWLSREDNGAMIIKSDLAYPAVLGLLGVDHKDVDQYWMEVAYQCVKMAAQDVARDNDLWPESGTLAIIIESGKVKDEWAIASYPNGKGVEAATKGGEAKLHYERIRRRLIGNGFRPT
jgi:hypothetical protein